MFSTHPLKEFVFMPPASIDRGHIVLPMSICLSVSLFAENIICLLFPITSILSKLQCSYWVCSSFRQYPTSEGHIIKVKVEYYGYISKKKMAVSAALVFHKHILFKLHCLHMLSVWTSPKVKSAREPSAY